MERAARSMMVLALACFLILAGCGNKPSENGEQTGQAGQARQAGQAADHPVVTMEMASGGIVKVELYPEIAPNTVNNFISLVQDGFYDGLIFHRVIPGFMIQGGDPEGTGMGDPGYGIKGEFASNGFQNGLKHERGIISMARSQHPDSAGSQFFIMVENSPHLDSSYASFGKVIDGMDVVDSIVKVDRDASDRPLEDQVIKKMTVDTFGKTYPEPEKVE